jgi:small-conductance mechanosensitive channel
MPGDLASLDTFLEDNDHWMTAVGIFAIGLVIAFVVDRGLEHRGSRVASAVMGGQLSRRIDTRLRFVRRVVTATIVLIALALALTQFEGVDRIAASLLASGVVAAAVVGFAARQTLANFVAGVMLAITQPVRVGDWVTIEGHYGVVEDVRLNYTFLRTAGDQRIVVPNEKLASSILTNDTLVIDAVGVEVSVWIPPGQDVARAISALADDGVDATVAEAQPWGVRLSIGGDPVPPPERAAREADLRSRCLARLHAEGLLEGFPPVSRS